jgi:hypothetical protein
MASVGMIHLGCYCGADLFYLTESPRGLTRKQIVEVLHEKLGPGDFGVLTPAEDHQGECPYCGLMYELPEPRDLKRLLYGGRKGIRAALFGSRRGHSGKGELSADVNARGRFLS